MSAWTSLETPNGRIRAWRAQPHIPPRGALVVVQEIFGVNSHIRGVCATFAEHGYVALAAERLHLPKKTLYDKLARHQLDPEYFRA